MRFVQDPSIRVTVVDCWATPQQDPNGELQHFLIEEGCGVDEVLDGTLDIIENGQSKMAKWAGSVFKFVGYEQVWLHCNIRVCFSTENCVPQCTKDRERRGFQIRRGDSRDTIRRRYGDTLATSNQYFGNPTKRRRREEGDEFELHTVSTSHPIRRVEVAIELDEISIETSEANGNNRKGETAGKGNVTGYLLSLAKFLELPFPRKANIFSTPKFAFIARLGMLPVVFT